ncbi:hypothetical protein AGMMS50229_19960 [Campylobacterota bacterium]|nr:hypothetical protein AGMMS50229_19960 [Campylobacterota bacterium]
MMNTVEKVSAIIEELKRLKAENSELLSQNERLRAELADKEAILQSIAERIDTVLEPSA